MRAWQEAARDNIGLISAGVAFYAFLALMPLLGAVVLTYGLVASPARVLGDLHALTRALPPDAAHLVGEQLVEVVKASDGKKGLGLLVALGIALFGAHNGSAAIVMALNVAYEEPEKRGFIALNLAVLGMTAAGIVAALAALLAIAALTRLDALLPHVPDALIVAGRIASYAALTLLGAAVAAALYRFCPSRPHTRWVWLTPGSLLAAAGWLALSLGFGAYAARFGHYNATYGSLSAVVVLLTWLYLSSYLLLLGAELNCECEQQDGNMPKIAAISTAHGTS
ncbi:YihY/virulence factor BrkB family protein [Novosphingobium sp.]|uniref:YihY/virulence factor BrkB family protein n=1 Tax=Novosphingobium sp. TaxID=1874826 RepID=UPI0025D2FB5D|nr:YihY/virulence factor BrkB family protein [Novosphingobium sp.]